MAQLSLPTVTLCAAASVNVEATVAALRRSMSKVKFARSILFTDRTDVTLPEGVERLAIPRMNSSVAYSQFMLRQLAPHIVTTHCLVVQWDGFVLDADRWEQGFLDFDYIGAPWPQFGDGHDVGNGGFSLRSRKLLDACGDPRFDAAHAEDVAIGRINRDFLQQERGIRFADPSTAARFAYERTPPVVPTFGFHGVFNMVAALGEDEFWKVYESLDDRTTAFADQWLLLRQLRGPGKWSRRGKLLIDRARQGFR